MSIIVTAASGHLGALIVDALLARGAAPSEVTATSRDVSRLAHFAERGIATATLDYTKPETVTAVVKPGDVLVLVSSDAIGQRFAQHSAVVEAATGGWVPRYRSGTVVSPTARGLTLPAIRTKTRDLFFHGYQPEPGDVVVDIGAEYGTETIVLSTAVGPTGRRPHRPIEGQHRGCGTGPL